MLSAALVLAMDAKNLLDVVDSVRIRYPEVDQMIVNSQVSAASTIVDPVTNTKIVQENAESSASSEVTSHYGLPNKITEHITAT